MKTVTINVTQEHIDKGKKGDCRNCMIALAVRHLFDFPIEVYPTSIFKGNGEPVSGFLPPIASDNIVAFDLGMDIQPFSFELKII